MTNHQLAKFGGHRHCGSEDRIVLVCLVVLQGHMIKEKREFIGRIPSG